jgi:hypothetical protein
MEVSVYPKPQVRLCSTLCSFGIIRVLALCLLQTRPLKSKKAPVSLGVKTMIKHELHDDAFVYRWRLWAHFQQQVQISPGCVKLPAAVIGATIG